MTNLEWIFNSRSYVDSNDSICILSHISRYHQRCSDKNCLECEFFKNNKECLKELSQDHEEKSPVETIGYELARELDSQSLYYIGRNIKTLRKQKHMTQAELTEKAGITQSKLSNYEKGKTLPRYDTLIKIARALDVNYTDILGYKAGK